MILLYQFIYGILALFMIWLIFEKKSIYDKVALAVLALPFILRALLIK